MEKPKMEKKFIVIPLNTFTIKYGESDGFGDDSFIGLEDNEYGRFDTRYEAEHYINREYDPPANYQMLTILEVYVPTPVHKTENT